MNPERSLDPLRTTDHAPPPGLPATVDDTGANPPATEPHRPAPPADAPTLPGYAITALIAKGGMGRVYAGRDLTLDREVAIKTLLPGANAERFVTEAKITARLPHPGIPPVHALGSLGDGSPYLAMKLIRGRTLADELKGRSSPADGLPRFVQAFEQIAQAVGFAHAQGIIHRDLKPLNVMVGEFGEVQVMDWGLAKDTRAGSVSDGFSPATADASHTSSGAVMGTPGYMAPEQARGEPADARADVFALGSVLTAILTGKPAFMGLNAPDTIQRSARADLADAQARLASCGADAELIALATNCLSADPKDRPADARAVAAEVAAYRARVEARLRRAETEAAESLVREAERKRRRRQFMVAAAALLLTLSGGLAVSLWQMTRANAERDAKSLALDAETEARAAEKEALDRALAALRSMTDEIVERQMSRTAALTEDNKEFLRTIIRQFEGFAAIKGDSADSRAVRAEGRHRVGAMRYRLGETKEAEAAFLEALAIRRPLADEYPDRAEFRRDLAGSHYTLGVLLSGTGRPKEAEAAYGEALAIQKRLAEEFPDRPEILRSLGATHNGRAVLLTGATRLKETEAALSEALAIQKRLVASHPKHTDYRQDLARTCNNLGVLTRATGRPKEAAVAYGEALEAYKRLASDQPLLIEYRQGLARIHTNLGVVLNETGRPKEAEAQYGEALEIQKRLVTDFPARAELRQELARSYNNLALMLRDAGRPKERESALAEAIAIQKKLVADSPTRPDYRHELASGLDNWGIMHSDAGRHKEAEAAYAEALAIYQRLAAEFPNQITYRQGLATTCSNLAYACNDMGEYARAKTYLDVARPHHDAALKAAPRNPSFRRLYRSYLGALIVTHAGLLDLAGAARAAATLRDLGWDPPANAHEAASVLCACVPLVEKHPKLDDSGRREAARRYADEAMTMLGDAVSKGYRNVKELREGADLAALRGRADFQKLLAGLEAAERKRPQ